MSATCDCPSPQNGLETAGRAFKTRETTLRSRANEDVNKLQISDSVH